jgi:hypothetical protein
MLALTIQLLNYIASNTNIDGHLEGIDDEFLLTATLASPAFTGTPTAPTATSGTNTTQTRHNRLCDCSCLSRWLSGCVRDGTKGIIEIATSTEASDGTDDLKAMTPFTVKERIDALSSTYQPLDPGLTSIAALTTSANKMIFTDGSDSYDTTDLTAFARSLLDDTDATTARATLSLGSAALLAADNTADNVVKLDSNGKLPAIDGSHT